MSLQLARTWLHGGERSLVQGNGLVQQSSCPNQCITMCVPFKGIFPWIIMQSQDTEDKLAQTHPKVSLSEMLGTYWLWVSVTEPVEEEVGFWFRQIRPNPDLFAFVHQVLLYFVSGMAAVYRIRCGKRLSELLSEKLYQTLAKKKLILFVFSSELRKRLFWVKVNCWYVCRIK